MKKYKRFSMYEIDSKYVCFTAFTYITYRQQEFHF